MNKMISTKQNMYLQDELMTQKKKLQNATMIWQYKWQNSIHYNTI